MRISYLIAAVAALSSPVVAAQTANWPAEKPVKIVVPYAAGGTADVLGRLVAQQLQEKLKQSFVVENRPGGGGLVGAKYVAQSTPDGYTLSLSGGGSHVISQLLAGRDAEVMSESTPIAMLGSIPSVLLVNPALDVKNVNELVTKVKSMPDGLSWGSPGTGTSSHLAGERLFRFFNVKNTHVPYQGGAPALNNLLGNQIPAAVMNLPAAVPHIKAEKLVALAITSGKRLQGLADIPSFADEGLPDSDTWYGLAGPAEMPAALVKKINAEFRQVVASEAVQKRLAQEYIQPMDMDTAETAKYVRNDFDRWSPLVKSITASASK